MDAILTLAPAARERAFVERGETLPDRLHLPIPLEALAPARRAQLAGWAPDLEVVHLTLPPQGKYSLGYVPGGRRSWGAPFVPADAATWERLLAAFAAAVATDAAARHDEAAAALTAALDRLRAGDGVPTVDDVACRDLPGYDEYRRLRAAAIAAREAREREADEARRRAQAAEAGRLAAAQARREAEKIAWVAAHGSAHLRRAVAAGYDCQRRYATERAALEHPGYAVDFDGQAEWRSRSCPSAAALAEAERVDGEVVWLTAPIEGGDPAEYEPYESREAVLLEDYLERYALLRAVE